MRGMILGLTLLGESASTQAGLGYPGFSNYNSFRFGNPLLRHSAGPAQNLWAYGQAGYPPSANYWGATNDYRAGWRRLASPPHASKSLSRVQGSWETKRGDLLVVEGHYARLYLSRDDYQNLEVWMNVRYLWLRPANSRSGSERYEYRFNHNQLALRDYRGRVLYLRRFNLESSVDRFAR